MEYGMPKRNMIFIILFLVLGGCTSSSELKKRASNNEKAGDYYESIGQPEVAKQEREMAQENRKNSRKFETLLFDILFGKDDKNKTKH
jgi:outer membrane protein OmpA-like peptidoglycan-associated protein|tara:strand:+ start:393 stop:656 length:264 start_codon:yes stop_codon:yes gene_type:complete